MSEQVTLLEELLPDFGKLKTAEERLTTLEIAMQAVKKRLHTIEAGRNQQRLTPHEAAVFEERLK